MATPPRRNGNTDRARGRVQAAVAPRPASSPGAKTLHQQISTAEGWFRAAMPSQFEARLLIRDAQHALRTVERLDEVDWPSLCGALMSAAQLGLRVGVLGQSWVLPFWDTRANHRRAQLIIGYQGYAELAHRSGMVESIVARSVRESDTFDVDYGAEAVIHKPALRGAPGPAYGYYALVRFRSGGRTLWYMTREEVEAHRDRFAMARKTDGTIVGPWVTDFDAMARKTALLQAVKYAPKTPEVAAAMAWDSSVREERPSAGAQPMDLASAGYIDGEVVGGGQGGAELGTPEPIPAPGETDEAATGEPEDEASEPPPAPPPPAVPAEPPAPKRLLSSGEQRALMALLKTRKVADFADRLMVLSHLAGRQVASPANLTPAEAADAVSRLESMSPDDLAELLKELRGVSPLPEGQDAGGGPTAGDIAAMNAEAAQQQEEDSR